MLSCVLSYIEMSDSESFFAVQQIIHHALYLHNAFGRHRDYAFHSEQKIIRVLCGNVREKRKFAQLRVRGAYTACGSHNYPLFAVTDDPVIGKLRRDVISHILFNGKKNLFLIYIHRVFSATPRQMKKRLLFTVENTDGQPRKPRDYAANIFQYRLLSSFYNPFQYNYIIFNTNMQYILCLYFCIIYLQRQIDLLILLVLRIFMKKDERFKNLTLAEKARLVQGTDFMYTCPVERLGIPPVAMADGPHGLRKQIGGGDNGVSSSEPATAFPTAAAVACSWDPENAHRMGAAIGEECRCYGVHTLLGPGVNIKRNPLCGRNFEYYSEDPLLAGKMGAAFCRGVGENGVTACVKHFALNNQENARFYGNSVVDERTVRELYLRPFELTVREGQTARRHDFLQSHKRRFFRPKTSVFITDILRGEWGFDGIVMSDWGGIFRPLRGAARRRRSRNAGRHGCQYKRRVCDAVADGSLDEKDLDRCVERLIAFADRFATVPKTGSFDIDGHANLAAEIAADSAVLLKNDGILPFDPKKKICVIGDLFAKMRYQGSGSSMINPTKTVSHPMRLPSAA